MPRALSESVPPASFGEALSRVRTLLELEDGGSSRALLGKARKELGMSGEAAASDIKSRAIDEIAKEQDLPDEATTLIKDAAGAEEVNVEDLKGLNYSAGVFINFRF